MWLLNRKDGLDMKKVVVLIVSFVLVMVINAGFSDATNFSDVGTTHWALPFINTLKSLEIIAGYPDGSFKPQSNVKINEFIAMTVKSLGYRFESMSSDWSKPYVDKAIELKIIQDREFTDYNAQINREQMTSIIVNAAVLNEYRPSNTMDLYIRNETKDFYLVGDYYKQNVLDSYKFGIITGFSDKTFRPKSFSTRAEASAVLSKLLNKDQRKPFVKTDARYTMFPVSQFDEFHNEFTVDQPLYAPLFNGKPVNEIIDVAEILKESAKQVGKGYLYIGTTQLSDSVGVTGFQSLEMYNSVFELFGIERAVAYAERSDFGFTVHLNDLSSKYNPYSFHINKSMVRAGKDPFYSTYFYRAYEEQIRPIFQYLFGNEFDKAWTLLKTGLDDNSEVSRNQVTINGRFVDLVSSNDGVYLTISLIK